MLNGRARNDILEAGYHRYAFHDERVPVWLADDERRHLRWAQNLVSKWTRSPIWRRLDFVKLPDTTHPAESGSPSIMP